MAAAVRTEIGRSHLLHDIDCDNKGAAGGRKYIKTGFNFSTPQSDPRCLQLISIALVDSNIVLVLHGMSCRRGRRVIVLRPLRAPKCCGRKVSRNPGVITTNPFPCWISSRDASPRSRAPSKKSRLSRSTETTPGHWTVSSKRGGFAGLQKNNINVPHQIYGVEDALQKCQERHVGESL
jgi:hypothetical protein